MREANRGHPFRRVKQLCPVRGQYMVVLAKPSPWVALSLENVSQSYPLVVFNLVSTRHNSISGKLVLLQKRSEMNPFDVSSLQGTQGGFLWKCCAARILSSDPFLGFKLFCRQKMFWDRIIKSLWFVYQTFSLRGSVSIPISWFSDIVFSWSWKTCPAI